MSTQFRNRVTVDLSAEDAETLENLAESIGIKPPALMKMALKKALDEIESKKAFTIPFARRAQAEVVEGGSDEH